MKNKKFRIRLPSLKADVWLSKDKGGDIGLRVDNKCIAYIDKSGANFHVFKDALSQVHLSLSSAGWCEVELPCEDRNKALAKRSKAGRT